MSAFVLQHPSFPLITSTLSFLLRNITGNSWGWGVEQWAESCHSLAKGRRIRERSLKRRWRFAGGVQRKDKRAVTACVCVTERSFLLLDSIVSLFFYVDRDWKQHFPPRWTNVELRCLSRTMKEVLTMKFAWKAKMVKLELHDQIVDFAAWLGFLLRG